MTINFQLSSLICCIVAVLAMFSAAALPAQPVWPRGTARVSGVVLDSSTRRPIVRTKICREVDLSPPHGKGTVCTSPDSVGRYVLADLPEGQQAVSFVCTGDRKLGRYLRFDTLIVGAGEEGRVDVITDGSDCDMRPFFVRRGLFRGLYAGAFEMSSFRACDESTSAGVLFGPIARDSSPPWPKPDSSSAYYVSTYYVEWEGTLRGPWMRAFTGGASYEMQVDRIRMVRKPTPSDCL